MSKYRLYYETVATTYIDVEADDEDEARDKAFDEFDPPDVCAYCAGMGYGGGPGIELGEWEPYKEDDVVKLS